MYLGNTFAVKVLLLLCRNINKIHKIRVLYNFLFENFQVGLLFAYFLWPYRAESVFILGRSHVSKDH